jgi:hypothetical protein
MKTLYESILDDEDVLMGGVKQDLDNPLIKLYSIYKKTNNLRDNMRDSLPIATDIMNTLKLSKCIIRVYDNRINVYHPRCLSANDSIITRHGIINPKYVMFQIRFAGDDYIEKRGAKCVIIEALANKIKTHIKAIEEFAKKYNLEKSPTGVRYILW